MKSELRAFFDAPCRQDVGVGTQLREPPRILPAGANRTQLRASTLDETTALRRFLAVVALGMMNLVQPALADEESDRLKLRALIDEGNLILEEAAGLEPLTAHLAAEGTELDAADRALRAESAALDADIGVFNASSADLQRATQELRTKCPRESEDKALVDSCNAQAAVLQTQMHKLNQERPVLQKRQQDLKSAVEAHNPARRDWTTRQGAHGARVQANREDADYWLGEARRFVDSGAFSGLVQGAGSPAACEAAQLRELASLPALAAAARVQACLKALDSTGR